MIDIIIVIPSLLIGDAKRSLAFPGISLSVALLTLGQNTDIFVRNTIHILEDMVNFQHDNLKKLYPEHFLGGTIIF